MTNQKASWRQICIEILQNGPSGRDQYQVAAALISEGYADGAIRKNLSGAGGPISNLHWRGPTLRGLEYADQLKDKLEKESTAYKMKVRLWNALSFGSGCIVTALVQSLF